MMDPQVLTTHALKRRPVIVLAACAVLLIAGLTFWLVKLKAHHTPPGATARLSTPVIRPDLVATGLAAPIGIVAAPDAADSRLFVVEQAGVIRIINTAGKTEQKSFLDISSKVLSDGEMGLLGLAFHPDYKRSGFLYVDYIDKNQTTVIARYHVSGDANIADPASEKILFTLKQPYVNHNGGDLVFGPDGYLYATLGDGGSGGDPGNRAQNKGSYFGKILRIDVNSGDPYSVPADNPFVHDADAKPEVWAYGLRNPWRISFDRLTGDLYIADVGQDSVEEVDVQRAGSVGGENYGWRCYEGNQAYNTANCKPASAYVVPVLTYAHQDGRCSITGGFVYRGARYPALTGKYFYGDFCSGQLFYVSRENGVWTNRLAATTPYAISTFGQGNDGELYFADTKTGSIYHIQDTANK